MEEILTNWAGLIAIFFLTGGLYEGTKRTIGAKAGDPGFKGFFYVWGRYLLMPIGAGFGALGHVCGVPQHEAFGDGMGGGVTAGIIAAAVAGFAYSQIIGLVKARLKHRAGKNGS